MSIIEIKVILAVEGCHHFRRHIFRIRDVLTDIAVYLIFGNVSPAVSVINIDAHIPVIGKTAVKRHHNDRSRIA